MEDEKIKNEKEEEKAMGKWGLLFHQVVMLDSSNNIG